MLWCSREHQCARCVLVCLCAGGGWTLTERVWRSLRAAAMPGAETWCATTVCRPGTGNRTQAHMSGGSPALDSPGQQAPRAAARGSPRSAARTPIPAPLALDVALLHERLHTQQHKADRQALRARWRKVGKLRQRRTASPAGQVRSQAPAALGRTSASSSRQGAGARTTSVMANITDAAVEISAPSFASWNSSMAARVCTAALAGLRCGSVAPGRVRVTLQARGTTAAQAPGAPRPCSRASAGPRNHQCGAPGSAWGPRTWPSAAPGPAGARGLPAAGWPPSGWGTGTQRLLSRPSCWGTGSERDRWSERLWSLLPITLSRAASPGARSLRDGTRGRGCQPWILRA